MVARPSLVAVVVGLWQWLQGHSWWLWSYGSGCGAMAVVARPFLVAVVSKAGVVVARAFLVAVVVGLWQWLQEHSGGSGCRAMAVVARAFLWQWL